MESTEPLSFSSKHKQTFPVVHYLKRLILVISFTDCETLFARFYSLQNLLVLKLIFFFYQNVMCRWDLASQGGEVVI